MHTFRHLKHFFGFFFESEKKHHVCVLGKEFPPESGVYVLPDQTKLDFWFKEPHKMLKHHIALTVRVRISTNCLKWIT